MDMWLMVFSMLRIDLTKVNALEVRELMHYCEGLFNEYPPELIGNDTLKTFELFKEDGIKMNIISNTGFASGDVVRRVLNKTLSFNRYFNNMIFSDECSLSKPNPDIFAKIYSNEKHQKGKSMHVGDHPIADGEGASRIGIMAYIINGDTDQTIEDVYKYVKHLNR